MEKILISIVTHNSEDIFRTLDVLAHEIGQDDRFKVVVYDNASETNYCKRLEKYSFIELICAKENQGFGHGHNQVILNSQAEYAFICNPDILVTKETLLHMRQLIERENIVAVSPKVLNEDGTTQYLVRQRLSVFDYFLRFIPFKKTKQLFDRRLSVYECRDLPDDKCSIIKMGSGCFMLVSVAAYKQIAGFDERFFMYFEDNDFCLRLNQTGGQILYSPFDQVVHLYGKGAHRNRKLFLIFMQSMFKFFNKWGWKWF